MHDRRHRGSKKIFFTNTVSIKKFLPVLEIAIVINDRIIKISLILRLLYSLINVNGNKKNAIQRKIRDKETSIEVLII